MDNATLKYMGKRVDEARKLTKRIAKLDDLLESLGLFTDVCFEFSYPPPSRAGCCTRRIDREELGGEDDARLADELTVVAIERVTTTRNRLADELDQL